jgi:PAS domain S-box-containing protein
MTVLYRFTDRLYRATGIEEVYTAALDAIIDALGADRASILEFDEDGVMRFVAWRGLSAEYREAVTGHTPWKLGEAEPDPIVIDDFAATDESDALKAAIAGEGLSALAFVPLVAQGGVIGKFMAYYNGPHHFEQGEIVLAVTIARQLGFAIERHRARQYRASIEDARQLLSSIVENSGDAIISKDLNGIINSWNKGAERLFGYQPHEIIGRSVLTLIPPELQHEEPGIIERIRRGERLEHYETVRQRKDGGRIHISLTVSPVKDKDGRIVGASKIARDISERKRADEQRILLINELNHRVKNSLAMVQSLAMQTLRGYEGSQGALRAFNSRLLALSRAHDVLTAERWEGASLHDVVDRALSPFRMSGQIKIDGPHVRLTPRQALALSIVLHELATNAVKYGALSLPAGGVHVGWTRTNGVLDLEWRETGGPAVTPPSRPGFGTHLIERSLAHDLGGEARILYLANGVVAHLSVPLEGQTETTSQ